MIEKENLTDEINLSGPPINNSKYTINQVFDLHDPLDTIPLSKIEVENIFLPPTEKITLQLLQKYQNIDAVIRQLKSWHKYKTKPTKADTTQLGNKTLLRYFRKHNHTIISQTTDLLEYQTPDFEVPCLPLSMMLIAFDISIRNIQKDTQDQKRHIQILHKIFTSQMHQFGLKYYATIA